MKYALGKEYLTLDKLHHLILNDADLAISNNSIIKKSRKFLDFRIKQKDKIYGVNTGFGSFCNVAIENKDLEKIQENLIRSHCCGMGEEVPVDIVKLMLLLKAQSFCLGASGVHLKTIETLIDLYNYNVIPVVYQQGSLGASGDLAPLSHLSLSLIGEGKVRFNEKKYTTKSIFKKLKINPIKLKAKEGLALINGTQFMSAYGVWSLIKAFKLSYLSDLISAISLEAFSCKKDPFDELVHHVRPHNGQIKTANRIREILKDSEQFNSESEFVQDPYSFRCIPQVHGATKDTLCFVKKTFETEINSISDNPLVFSEENRVISAGNFHGQPLALGLDYLSIAMAELGSISERRVFKLISGSRGLPEYLIQDSGINSGFMIPQYTAASMVSQNKQLCTPSSVDSITSSNGQEDHVSMGANAATKTYLVINNVEKILSIELLTACQALDLRGIEKTSPFIKSIVNEYRKEVPFVKTDTLLKKLIDNSHSFIKNIEIDNDLLFE